MTSDVNKPGKFQAVHVTVFKSNVASDEQWRTHFSSRVENRLSFRDWFLRSPWESNEHFLGAASAISRPVICQVSMAGKHFLHQFWSMEIALFVYHSQLTWIFFWSFAGGTGMSVLGLFLRETLVWWLNFKKSPVCPGGPCCFNGQNQTWSLAFFAVFRKSQWCDFYPRFTTISV